MTAPSPRLHIQPTYLFFKHTSHSPLFCGDAFTDELQWATLRLRQRFEVLQALSTLHHIFLVTKMPIVQFRPFLLSPWSKLM